MSFNLLFLWGVNGIMIETSEGQKKVSITVRLSCSFSSWIKYSWDGASVYLVLANYLYIFWQSVKNLQPQWIQLKIYER